MVDVGGKEVSFRRAIAEGIYLVNIYIVIKIILKKQPRFGTLALYDEFLRQLFLLSAGIHLYKIYFKNYLFHFYLNLIFNRTNIILPRLITAL